MLTDGSGTTRLVPSDMPSSDKHSSGMPEPWDRDEFEPTQTDIPLAHLRAAGVSLVLDWSAGTLPVVQHWGADLGPLSAAQLVALARANARQGVTNMTDDPPVVSLLPEAARAWFGTPGLSGHRRGREFSPRLELQSATQPRPAPGLDAWEFVATDPAARLAVTLTVQLDTAGLVKVRAAVRNIDSRPDGAPYQLDALHLALPVPLEADELADFTGRHLRERAPQRGPFTLGTHVRESRRGRPGADATLLLLAGRRGFASRSGEVWGVHIGWSGNHRVQAERLATGDGLLSGGELLLPGEIELAPGDVYTSPWLYASYGNGLDELAGRFHDHLRARPHHPPSPRPVTLNTWEAVYFDHDPVKLAHLATLAASVGVERFVLDDGWFLSRRSDDAGLGDWQVDPAVWPDGLAPLAHHVRDLGMQFGLWVEPEMISPNSELARFHPDWILASGERLPPLARHQQALDLANPEAFAHIAARLDALVRENGLDYLKWDHNRDLIDAGHPASGRAGIHDQTLAVYRLMDELKRRHPSLEIESCSSGGCRIDLGIAQHTDRVWASDCNDALERLDIARYTELLLPPELIGAHVGAPIDHSTGRSLALDLRAGAALGFHFGIEWDLTSASPAELEELRRWVQFHREHRELLHTGRVVHADLPDPALVLRGVVAADRRRAIYTLISRGTSITAPPGRLTLPGLADDAQYRVALWPPEVALEPQAATEPLAWATTGLALTGAALRHAGIQAPALHPGRVAVIECQPIDGPRAQRREDLP